MGIFQLRTNGFQAVGLCVATTVLSGCSVFHHGFIAAAGPVAGDERRLFLIVGVAMIFVVAPVLLLTPLIVWHYRLSNTRSAYRPQWGFSWPLEGLIWIPPTLIVVGLAFVLWDYTHRLDPYRPLASSMAPLEVQAVALDWKWVFIYPDQHIATVDELVFPAGRPVHLSLTSGTVMQSLLMPRLAGQIFAMAGMKTQLNVAADRPGVYLGENTQFNGDGFQNERFPIYAMAPGDFGRWLVQAQSKTQRLDASAYRILSARSTIAHPIVFGGVEPDLFRHILNQPPTGSGAMQDNPGHD